MLKTLKILIVCVMLTSCRPYYQTLPTSGVTVDSLAYTPEPMGEREAINRKEHEFIVIVTVFVTVLFIGFNY